MLDTMLAKKFIEKIGLYTDYNINIMDDKGIIIASKTDGRIGTFHEIAFQIINGEADLIIVDNDEDYLGVKAGVNMAFFYKNKKVGVVGITGDPDEIKPIALIIKMSIETMLEYELYKEKRYQRRNMKEQLLFRILYRNDVDEKDILVDAGKLGLREDLIRVPIYMSVIDKPDMLPNIMSTIRSSRYHSKQDLMCSVQNNALIIFKELKGDISCLMENYKYIVGEFLSPVLQLLRHNNMRTKLCVGTFQNSYINYRYGYRHCQWLYDNVHTEKSSCYFYDYIDDYFRALIPMTELKGVFDVFKSKFDDKFIKDFVEVIEPLYKTNYNISESSKEMFIHKNTLMYRFNKIRESLGVNPLIKSNDREFMNNLSLYLKSNNNRIMY